MTPAQGDVPPDSMQGLNRRRNPDGSEILFDSRGAIQATVDVLGERREFAVEPKSGRLMVRRFGLWTKPEQARIDENGSLYFRRGAVEILERLDGVHIQANKTEGLSIRNDQKNRTEVIEMANGEVWQRQITDEQEEFCIWRNGSPSFKSETYFKPARYSARTPSGIQALSYVSRHEESWERGEIAREKFSFNNDTSSERHVAVALQLGRGMLMLRNVTTVTTLFAAGAPSETTYVLIQPTTLKIDIPIMKASFDKVTQIRSLQSTAGASISFGKADGSEQIINLIER